MAKIKAILTFERNWDHQWYSKEYEFNDEQHMQNFIKKCASGTSVSKSKYIGSRIVHASEKKIFDLNEAQIIFDMARDKKYLNLKELLKEEFKINI